MKLAIGIIKRGKKCSNILLLTLLIESSNGGTSKHIIDLNQLTKSGQYEKTEKEIAKHLQYLFSRLKMESSKAKIQPKKSWRLWR